MLAVSGVDASVGQRIDQAIASGERVHPGYGKEVRDGISVAWPNVRHNLGGWAVWTPQQKGEALRCTAHWAGPRPARDGRRDTPGA